MNGLIASLQRQMSARDIPGVSLRVAQAGRTLFAEDLGKACIQTGEALTGATRMPIGCLTKPLAAHAVLDLLFAQGCGPQARVRDVLPALTCNPTFDKMTVRHLLTHVSGLPRGTYTPERQAAPAGLQTFRGITAVFPLETTYKYSNLGFQLVGEVITALAGVPADLHLCRAIFEPLGMTRTGFSAGGASATGYWKGWRFGAANTGLASIQCPQVSLPKLAGGVVSTADDMMRWLALFDGASPLIRPETIAAMTAGGVKKPGGKETGPGFHCETINGANIHYFPGTASGFSALMLRVAAHDLTAVAIGNQTSVNDVLRRMLDSVVQERCIAIPKPRLTRRVAPLSVQVRGDGRAYRLFTRPDDTLILQDKTGAEALYVARSPSAFFPQGAGDRRHMLRLRYKARRFLNATIGPTVLRHDSADAPRLDPALDNLSGTYTSPTFGRMHIFARGSDLIADYGAIYETRLVPLRDGTFRNQSGPFKGEVIRFDSVMRGLALAELDFAYLAPLKEEAFA